MLDTVKSWLRQITEVGLLLIAAALGLSGDLQRLRK